MRIGIIGVGHLGSALARGYVATEIRCDVILSPRGSSQSIALYEEHGLEIAPDNAEVVRNADVVIIATRPNDVVATIRMLPWRVGQTVICVAAGVSLGALRGAVVPAEPVRAMPVLASAINESAIPLYPATGAAVSALSPLGRLTPCPTEEAFAAVSALGAWFGWLFALTGTVSESLVAQGVSEETARKATADMMRAAGAMIAANPRRDPNDVMRDLATPGGITEAGLQILSDADAMEPWSNAMLAAFDRLQKLT